MLTAVTAHNGPAMVPASDPVTIKLSAYRRLLEPRSGRYVTFDELGALSRRGTVAARNAGAGATRLILSHPPTEY
jgi:hypothetical protein